MQISLELMNYGLLSELAYLKLEDENSGDRTNI